jgi:E3 ubiquitin-protein ligase CHFR
LEEGVFKLTDTSSNGTYVNDKKLNKDESANLHNGDKIYFLNDEAESVKIGFIFVAVYQKPVKTALGEKRGKEDMEVDEEDKQKDEKNDKRIKRMDTPAGVEQMKCSFCLEIMYKPVSLIPCLHNFCGG